MGKTLSFGKGKGNVRHNNREFITENVDKDRIKDNVIYKQEPIETAYEKCFGKAIEEYNAGQRRADRHKTIQGYMDEIKKNQANKNGEKLFYEQVVGIGDMKDSGILLHPEEAEKCKEVLDQYAREFQQRNPNLHVFNMVLHMDEQTPHLHIDYIPRAEGYKQGLQVRNSLTKAFDNMGIESTKTKNDNSTMAWQRRERERITEIAKEHGIQIDYIGEKRQDMTVEQYKATMAREEKRLKPVEDIERVNLPLGMKLETYRQSQKIDKTLEDAKKAKTVVQQTKSALQGTVNDSERLKNALEDVRKERKKLDVQKNDLQRELSKAQIMKAKAEALLYEQESLNEKYSELVEQHEQLKVELKEKDRHISALESRTDDKVQDAIKPYIDENKRLKAKVNSLVERLDGMCQSLTNVTKAFGMLKHDRSNGYQVPLNEKQSRLFDAISNYTSYWLRDAGKHEMAADVEKHVEISKGIQDEIKELQPKRSIDRGGR